MIKRAFSFVITVLFVFLNQLNCLSTQGAHVTILTLWFVCVFVPQRPAAGSQTSLSLQECLRLLEATFPFGEESEVTHAFFNKCL